jgi:hypothetical protein
MEKAKAGVTGPVYSPFTIYHSQKKPRAANNAGSFFKPDFVTAVERLAELFSGFFYVAASRLNSPRFVLSIETSNAHAVNSTVIQMATTTHARPA